MIVKSPLETAVVGASSTITLPSVVCTYPVIPKNVEIPKTDKFLKTKAKSTKLIQENTTLNATKQVLENSINESTQLTADQTAELDELKLTDLDEWFSKKTQYENEAKQLGAGKIKELTDAASEKAFRNKRRH